MMLPRRQGSIPACTGKPASRRSRVDKLDRSIPACTGKPPSTSMTTTRKAERSIPACTGKPLRHRIPAGVAGIHGLSPRVRGNQLRTSTRLRSCTGLSPRVRGNHALVHPCTGRDRSIPACTGKPPRPRGRRMPQRVYPRVYGETSAPRTVSVDMMGLSSRVRGNQLAHSAP